MANTLKMVGITKKYGDFIANNKIDLDVKSGEIHALLGENGAGKTTLMNVLYGLLNPNEGKIFIDDKLVKIDNPNIAIENGIGMVHQHFMLIEPFTVAQNIILGKETTKLGGVLDIKKIKEEISDLIEKYGLNIDLNSKVSDITVGMQQRVEIIKTLYRGADILILDEPTAVLTPQEIRDLMKILRNLSSEGKIIIIITHKLKEIKEVADYCTIIRKGKKIDTVKVSDVSESDLASKMVGREVSFVVEKEEKNPGETTFEIKNLTVKDSRGLVAVDKLNIAVKKGEILGIAGVDGNGQTELIEAITGLKKAESGSIVINGNEISNLTPRKVFKSGIAHIPQDRQKRGLILDYTIAENFIIEVFGDKPFSERMLLNFEEIDKNAEKLIEKFDVRPPEKSHLAGSLSGGNQQKVIIAREVSHNPDVLIAAQPTRGLDVGAIEYVHKSLVNQRNNGKAVLLISFELDEVMNVSDRIAVIYEGKIVGIVDAKSADENALGLMMAGGGEDEK